MLPSGLDCSWLSSAFLVAHYTTELPYNSRAHILQEYNRGVYDCMIAVADDISARTKKESEARDLMLDGKHLNAKVKKSKGLADRRIKTKILGWFVELTSNRCEL